MGEWQLVSLPKRVIFKGKLFTGNHGDMQKYL